MIGAAMVVSAIIAAQPAPAFLLKVTKKATDDPAVVVASFVARQECPGEEDNEKRHYSVTGTYPRLVSKSDVAAKINRDIRATVAQLVATDVPQCPLPVRVSQKKHEDGEIECECKAELRTAKLFSVRCESSSAGSDFGAHPHNYLEDLVFDMATGRRLDLDAMLIAGKRETFRGLMKANLDIAGMVDPDKIEDAEKDQMLDAMMKHCSIDREYLTCQAPYWPLTYFTGGVELSKLKGIVRPEILAGVR
jgi:hypothetical protein